MKIVLRLEQEKDHKRVESLIREAFWNVNSPGCCEHYVAHVLRSSPAFINELNFVAACDDIPIASIMYTEGHILKDNGEQQKVLCFGPFAVLPRFQGKGIGKMLIDYTKQQAKVLGYTAILIYGDPAFYKPLGFIEAEAFNIANSQNQFADALFAWELKEGALKDCAGCFIEAEAFNINRDEIPAFDKKFAPKKPLSSLPSQKRFTVISSKLRPREC